MNATFKRQLPTPSELRKMYPLDAESAAIKKRNDEEVMSIFKGESKKLLLIIGPCSADREDAVLDYMRRLARLYPEVSDVLTIVPRLYTNKPRTTGAGYKGMLHQPDPTKDPDMLRGLIAIRKMHMKVIKETGFSCADEMLYPENHTYLQDCLSYVAVGARSVEDQQHRLVASMVDVPTGMKNPISGDLIVMLNSINAAQHGHHFIYRGWEVSSGGNPLAHAILRGWMDKEGHVFANYHYEDILDLLGHYTEEHFQYPSILVDCNHCNSGKNPFEQPRIAMDVLNSIAVNERIRKTVKGLMIESYLVDGNQKVEDGVYGKSITDACLGWEKSEDLIRKIAAKVREINSNL